MHGCRSSFLPLSGWVSRMLRGWLREMGQTLALGLPIMAGFVGQMLMGIADTMMVGRVGTVPLAAAAFAHNLYNIPLIGGIGLLSAVSVLTSHAFGAGRREAAGEVLRHGLWLSLICGVLAGAVLWASRAHYGWLRQPPEVLAAAQTYLLLVGWSMLPALVSHALKQFSEALNHPWPPMLILLGGVLLNVLLNWILIFGKLGAPALGLDGAGLATLLARVATAATMLCYVLRSRVLAPYRPPRWRARCSIAAFRRQWDVGAPVAVQHLLEVGAFVAAALMMGWIGPEAMAAHQIAITCAATSFMFALGVGMAVAIRVGHAWGAQDFAQLRKVGFSGFTMGAAIMSVFAILFMAARWPIAGAFTPDGEVVELAARMLWIAALFQVFDGLQVVAISALRGMADVRMPAVIAGLAYWGVALPLGYVLGFFLEGGALGIWVGLAAGLATAAGSLIDRFRRISRRSALPSQDSVQRV